MATIGAISSGGRSFYHFRIGNVNSDAIAEFITELKAEMPGRIALFWDNARTHASWFVADVAEDLGIPMVFNLAYKPENNGIEKLWAVTKHTYRKRITEMKAEGQRIDEESHVELVKDVFNALSRDTTKLCAKHGWTECMKDTGVDLEGFQNFAN